MNPAAALLVTSLLPLIGYGVGHWLDRLQARKPVLPPPPPPEPPETDPKRLTLIHFGWEPTLYNTWLAPGEPWHSYPWTTERAYERVMGRNPERKRT